MVDAMNAYWAEHPPLHILAAVKWGFKPTSSQSQSIEEASEFVPVASCSSQEFDELLAKNGLPI